MDVLKDKKYNDFDYTCRYTSIPYYYNTLDDKYIFGIGKQLLKDVSYVAHKVTNRDTLESLALKYYNNPTLYWVIAYFNDVMDSFEMLSERYEIIKIPNISSVLFGEIR